MSSRTHATLRYTALRLGIFLGCLVVVSVLAYAGIIPEGIGRSNPFWVLLLALVLSAPLSYVLLRRQREAMAEQVASGVDRARSRLAANRSMEDDDADDAARDSAGPEAEPATATAEADAAGSADTARGRGPAVTGSSSS
ncbi:DUF4229 domain-containing protein [Streptomyces sp. JJ36]|uniref:DUF4229 domain-containing protein n=1 Tax=Streptomyces sp. JJ36 TaxID=2736645 RepID=UPI001F335F77|nr:DUF4229 domain-containing protein [Streptomyces sp. JJ36]